MKTGGTLQVRMLLYTAGNFVCFLGGCEILYTDKKNFFLIDSLKFLFCLTPFMSSNFRGINISGPSNFQCWGRKTGAPTK